MWSWDFGDGYSSYLQSPEHVIRFRRIHSPSDNNEPHGFRGLDAMSLSITEKALDQDDITLLQNLAVQENWGFTVGATEFTGVPLSDITGFLDDDETFAGKQEMSS